MDIPEELKLREKRLKAKAEIERRAAEQERNQGKGTRGGKGKVPRAKDQGNLTDSEGHKGPQGL